MPGIWFTSDLHLGHARVAELRGFACVEHHDATLAGAWDRSVRDGDIVWILGDLTLGNPEPALSWVDARPGVKHLIAGNHDRVHPMHRTSHRETVKHAWLGTFHTIQTMARRKIAGCDVLLSHFPYPGTDRPDRTDQTSYDQWRLPNMGLPLLHGHTHSLLTLSTNSHAPQIHVGLDAWGLCPVSLAEVTRLIEFAGEIL